MIRIILSFSLLLNLSFGELTSAQNLPSQVSAQPPDQPSTPPPANQAPAQTAVQAPQASGRISPADLLSGIIEDYTYTAGTKRDPFLPYETIGLGGSLLGPLFPLQKFDIDQLKLVGIIWDVKSPKAMILDPTGKGYVVKINERIGRNSGYIARIRESELVVVEMFKSPDGNMSYVTKLMKLTTQ